MANPTTVEGLLSAVQNHGANHRSSLSVPVIPKTTGGAHVAFGPGHTPQPRYNRNRSISNGQYSVYGAFPHPRPVPWLNKLCHEPEGDIGTCCLGYWLPCALYGNTQYRLKQMAQGDDPSDLSEHRHNNGPCWMHQMLCFFFRCEWCVVMLQHSRIRATYNIDGTAGGDCVQSYYCPCCTLMQDEREVVAREQRILRQQKGDEDGEVREQPGFEPQMRYSTSNLLEEIPDIFREHTGSYPSSTRGLMSGEGSARESRRHSLEGSHQDAREGHEMDNLQPFSLGHSDSDMSCIDESRIPRSRSRCSSNSSGKLRVRETSPLGSALNPITVSRSVSVDHGLQKPKQHADVPQRSITSPTRRRSLKDTNPPPASRNLNYRLKSITTDDRPDFLIETIKEGSESSNHAPTINSRTAVKSMAMDSLRSVASKNTYPHNTFPRQNSRKEKKSTSGSQDDLRTDEAYTTFYNDQGKMVRRRISECLRPRASTPETPDIYQLHHANPNDDEKTMELKRQLSRQAREEKREREEARDRKRVKLKMPAVEAGTEHGVKSPTVAGVSGFLLTTTPAIAEALPTGTILLNDRGQATPLDKSISTVVTAATEKSGGSDILSLPEGVNDADELALYLDQAVQDSGLKLKNQKSMDRSAMPDLPIGAMAPRKQTLRLDFNSEDEGSELPTAEEIACGLDYKTKKTERSPSSRVSPRTIPDAQGTGVPAVDRYPSYIVTSDGAAVSPLDTQPGTPLDPTSYSGHDISDVVKEFGQLTPRHKKSVSDWFKDIGRSNSNKSEKEFTVKVHRDEVPPVPILPALFKEQGFSLGPLRSFSPLGFMGRKETKEKAQFATMGPAQKLAAPEIHNRTVSAPMVPAMPLFANQALADATNNSNVDNIMETQDQLQVLQDEFKIMAEDITYEINNQSPTPTPAAIGESWGVGDWLSPSSSTIDISSSSKEIDNVTPAKLKQRSFPLIKSDKSTPTSSLSKATATTFLVSLGDVAVDHSRHGADTSNANVYSNKTLITTIKELSSTPIYGASTPTTFAQSLEDLGFDMPTNLETPSAIPEGFLEHMPGEFPISPSPETPAAVDEVVIKGMSPARYFPLIGTRTSSLKVEGSDDTTSQRSSPAESKTSDNSAKSGHSGHIHEDQQIEVANQFESASAAAAMNTTCTARNISGTLDDARESDPFSHPFFSGTAVIDFALLNPKKLRDQLKMSDDMGSGGSEETIRPTIEANPLGVDGCMASAEEENPLHTVDSTSSVTGSILGTEDEPRNMMPALTPIAEASREVSVSTVPEVLKGDDVTALPPPPDHPTTAERIDDALAAVMTGKRGSRMHGALTKPILEADNLRDVCDLVNRGALSYESDEDIITVGPHGPVLPKTPRSKKERRGSGLGHMSTVVRRTTSPERAPRSASLGTARMQAALKEDVGGTPKIVIGDKTISDKLIVSDNGVSPLDTARPIMPAAVVSPKRVHSPAEVKLREMLGKVMSPGKDIDMKGDTIVGQNSGGGGGVGRGGDVKKKNSKNSPQRRRNRAEKKRREREEGKAGK